MHTGHVPLDRLLTSPCLSSSFLRWAENSTYLRTVTGSDEPHTVVASQCPSNSTAPKGGTEAQASPDSFRGTGALQQETQAIPAATQDSHLLYNGGEKGLKNSTITLFRG